MMPKTVAHIHDVYETCSGMFYSLRYPNKDYANIDEIEDKDAETGYRVYARYYDVTTVPRKGIRAAFGTVQDAATWCDNKNKTMRPRD